MNSENLPESLENGALILTPLEKKSMGAKRETSVFNDKGAQNLIVLVSVVWCAVFIFFGFLALRARMWSPYWVIHSSSPSVVSGRRKP